MQAESTQNKAQEEALIDDLTDAGFWSEISADLSIWLDQNLLTETTLIEIGVIALCAIVAWPVSRSILKFADTKESKPNRSQVLNRFIQTARSLCFPGVWLAIQVIALGIVQQFNLTVTLLGITTSLLTAWVIVKLATTLVANSFWSNLIAISAWSVAALNIVGVLTQTLSALDEIAFSLGEATISVLTVLQALFALGILLWLSSLAGHVIEGRLHASPNLTPSIRVLSTKLIRIGLATFAVLGALSIVGVDLTALAVFGGAVGVGLGFGLQKIFANLVSGFILLLDKSIKPGDTIAVHEYYGRVDSLGARYVSVTTRDGIEHLIPNEELITTRVENWSHSHNLLRLRKVVGVHYNSDIPLARQLCLEATAETERVLDEPKSVCLIKDFGESSVDLEIRFWINDPMNGRANVTSEVLERVWDKFHAHNIQIPFPQRDLHLKSSEVSLG